MKYGLVLSGGGGKGGYHIGVWKALRELNIEIGAVTGTSVGSLIGAMIVQDEYDYAYEIWANMHYSTILNVDEDLYTSLLEVNKSGRLENLSQLIKKGEQLWEQKGLDISPLKNLIKTILDEEKIRKSHMDYGLVTVSLSDMKSLELFSEDIPEGKMADYLLASSYLPVFAPMELDGKRFIDGAFHDNLPVNMMLKKNVDIIIAVDIGGVGRKQKFKTDKEIIQISPSGQIAALMEFDANQSKKDIQMGYMDTLKAFHQVSGLAYYIDDLPKELDIISFMDQIPQIYMIKLFEVLKITTPITLRNVFEHAIPQIAKLFGCNHHASYIDIMVTVLEYLAANLEVERLQRYTYHQFLYILLKKIDDKVKPSKQNQTTYTMESIRQRLGFTPSKQLVAKLLLGAYKCLYDIIPPNLLNSRYTVRPKNNSL